MAHFLREKKLGLNNDFSAGLTPEQFEIDDVSCFFTLCCRLLIEIYRLFAVALIPALPA